MKRLGSILILLFAFAAMTASLYALDPVFHFRIEQWRSTWNVSNIPLPKTSSRQVSGAENVPHKLHNGRNKAWAKLDAHALHTPQSATKNIIALADYLIQPCKNDMEKARVIFRWLANNIVYDDVAYNTDALNIWSSEEVLDRRMGVCEDFSNLFLALSEAAGLEAVKISGYSKGYGFSQGERFEKPNHAWNAFKADGTWHLLDATWGQGNGVTVNGKLKSKKAYADFWFDTDPKAFVFSHLPEAAQWQLLEAPILLSTYEKMPAASPEIFNIGFSTNGLLQAGRKGQLEKLVTVYDNALNVRAIKVNPSGRLTEESDFEFIFECKACSDMVFINNGGWTFLDKSGSRFTGAVFPTLGELTIFARRNKKEDFRGVLKYEIVAKPIVMPPV